MHVDGGSYCSRRWWRQLLQQTTLLCLGTQDAEHFDAVPFSGNREWCDLPGGNCVPPRSRKRGRGRSVESSGAGGAKLFEADARRDGDNDEEDGAEQGWKSRGGEAGCGRRLAACKCYESVTSYLGSQNAAGFCAAPFPRKLKAANCRTQTAHPRSRKARPRAVPLGKVPCPAEKSDIWNARSCRSSSGLES